MVIGHGLIARTFARYQDRSDILLFASGVSNSREMSEDAFAREWHMLQTTIRQHPTSLFVYFGTTSVDDPDVMRSPYVQHKRQCEEIVQGGREQFLIFRLPQLVGRTPNPHTITNFLSRCIHLEEPFDLWARSVRYLIDIDDVEKIVTTIIEQRRLVNQVLPVVSCPSTIPEIVRVLEMIIGKKARYRRLEKGAEYTLDHTLAHKIAEDIGIQFDDGYVERILRKYYRIDHEPLPRL